MEQTLEAAVAAGKPPAIAQLELTTMAQLAADGALVPIPSLLGSECGPGAPEVGHPKHRDRK